MELNKIIYPDDYDIVICVDGKGGRLFEYGKETTRHVKKIELTHEAGKRAELTVKRQVVNREVKKYLENE